jgi:putative ABC transport system ATP-binding protein
MEVPVSVGIRLCRIDKHYERGAAKVSVLRDVSLTIEAGSFTALMGPSGSGKTTLLNLIGGLDRPSGGTISVGGHRLNAMSERELTRWRRTNVGFVFQMYNLLPRLSAEANVEAPLLLTSLGRKSRASKVASALAAVGLSERASHRPGELSGGQQQRVAIARAIVTGAPLLVCDEPTGDLDRRTGAAILQLLRLLNEKLQTTIVMVTHDPSAASVADYCLQVDKGTLMAEAGCAA